VKEKYQPEVSTPLAYKRELTRQEKDSILKEVYSTIQLFYNLIYEAKKKSLVR
jgi:hypothetical protein